MSNAYDPSEYPPTMPIGSASGADSGVGYTVILEGILSNKKYGAMLHQLLNDFQGEKLIYSTLRRTISPL